jgi:isopenicillin-N N-acyltransferase-like protein
MSEIPHITISGDPRACGLSHGRQLKERIRETFDFYAQKVFRASPLGMDQIRERATLVRNIVLDFKPEYATEIDAIAEGAEMEAWQIYALNARTEILNAETAECTAVFFRNTGVLGQNWDWVREMEDQVVLLHYDLAGGHRIATLTEPGMLAKIGLNGHGIGVCLNILFASHKLDGLPVHILLRAILDCESMAEVRETIERAGGGKSSHFLVADYRGDSLSIEFAGSERYEVQPFDGCLIHTNHYIGNGAENAGGMVPGSAERLTQGREWLRGIGARDLEHMKSILLDDSAGAVSINSPYHAEELLGGLEVGTCATVIMDLLHRTLYLKKGPGADDRFVSSQV